MIDSMARRQLAEELGRLVVGERTNYEFDELYYSQWKQSDDRAVAEIAQFGWSLYSSDVEVYRLTGWHAVGAEARRAGERCRRFLMSDLEYEWPPNPNLLWAQILGGFSIAILLAPALLLIVLDVVVFCDKGELSGILLLLTFLFLGSSFLAYLGWRSYENRKWRRWRASGEWPVWPFFRRADFEQWANA